MSTTVEPAAAAVGVAVASEAPAFAVPAKHNPRLQAVVGRLNADEELQQLWRCANVNALERLGLGDHGEVHVRIVANAALRLLRLLRDAGHAPGVVAQYRLPAEEAEVVVVLAAALHDVGLAAFPGCQPEMAPALAGPKARELLAPLYPPRERTILVSEVLHALAGHYRGQCHTLEGGVLHLADALDIAEGRAAGRGIFDLQPAPEREGVAARVQAVSIRKGSQRPVQVEIRLADRAGAAELGHLAERGMFDLLKRTLREAALAEAVEVVGRYGGRKKFSLEMLAEDGDL